MFQNALVIFAYFAAMHVEKTKKTSEGEIPSQENKNFPLNKSH